MNEPGEHTLSRAGAMTRLRRSDTLFALSMMAPALIVVGVVIVYPLARSLLMAFQKYDLTEPASVGQWVGLSNFVRLFRDRYFLDSCRNALTYGVGTVLGQFIVGFACALMLNQRVKFRNWYRGVYLLPWVIPPISAALLWWWIFDFAHGVINLTLRHLGLVSNHIPWIASPDLAMYSVTAAVIWRMFPFDMVMLLAGLQTISSDLLDAAAVDGAGWIQRLRYVVVPHLRNIIVVILLLASIWSLQEFTMLWGMTKGGPVFATRTLNLFIYQTSFEFFRMGEGSAGGLIWLVVLLVFSVIVVKLGLREEGILS